MTSGFGEDLERSVASDGPNRRREDALLQMVALPVERGFRVIGTVDPSTRPAWEESLDMLVARGGGVVDLSGLSFADLRAVDALIAAAHRVRPPGALRIHRPPASVQKVLRLFWPEEFANILAEDGPR